MPFHQNGLIFFFFLRGIQTRNRRPALFKSFHVDDLDLNAPYLVFHPVRHDNVISKTLWHRTRGRCHSSEQMNFNYSSPEAVIRLNDIYGRPSSPKEKPFSCTFPPKSDLSRDLRVISRCVGTSQGPQPGNVVLRVVLPVRLGQSFGLQWQMDL